VTPLDANVLRRVQASVSTQATLVSELCLVLNDNKNGRPQKHGNMLLRIGQPENYGIRNTRMDTLQFKSG
jgi:hypothetical protein